MYIQLAEITSEANAIKDQLEQLKVSHVLSGFVHIINFIVCAVLYAHTCICMLGWFLQFNLRFVVEDNPTAECIYSVCSVRNQSLNQSWVINGIRTLTYMRRAEI